MGTEGEGEEWHFSNEKGGVAFSTWGHRVKGESMNSSNQI